MINFTNKIKVNPVAPSSLPYHIPALLPEAIDLLNINPSGIYIDATFGGGGHSRAIMQALGEKGRLFSFDRDIDSFQNRINDPRFTFVHGNFRHIVNFMRFYKVNKVDGILADFGVSFHHFDSPGRGFSFRSESQLDMRMNQLAKLSAFDIVNEADEAELSEIFRKFTDLKKPVPIVKAILSERALHPIQTTTELVNSVKKAIDPRQEKKELAQVFQAIRIAVNHEADDLQAFLVSTLKVLKPGGRLVTLTYHSMEDRMVKNFMKTGNPEGVEIKDFYGRLSTPWKLVTRKPLEATPQEVEFNPRSRSARLRAAELI